MGFLCVFVDEGMVHGDTGDIEESLSRLRSRLTRSMMDLAKSELSLLQIEIVEELLLGRRTVTELVETIYSVRRGEYGFSAQYSRIRRELRELESRGFVVSKKFFGRDKPYGLTQLCVARLTSIEGVEPGTSRHIVPRIDLVLYLGVIVIGIVSRILIPRLEAPGISTILLACFFFTSGLAVSRFLQTLKRVI